MGGDLLSLYRRAIARTIDVSMRPGSPIREIGPSRCPSQANDNTSMRSSEGNLDDSIYEKHDLRCNLL
jgi:hypothetical protein